MFRGYWRDKRIIGVFIGYKGCIEDTKALHRIQGVFRGYWSDKRILGVFRGY